MFSLLNQAMMASSLIGDTGVAFFALGGMAFLVFIIMVNNIVDVKYS